MNIGAILAAGLLCVLTIHAAHAGSQNPRPIPPGLLRVMAEGAGRMVTPTCADVRAVVTMVGEAKAEQGLERLGRVSGRSKRRGDV